MLFRVTHKLFHQSIAFSFSRKMSTEPPFLQVLATSVSAVNKAGDLIREIMYSGKLDIVEKEGPADLQVSLYSKLSISYFLNK